MPVQPGLPQMPGALHFWVQHSAKALQGLPSVLQVAPLLLLLDVLVALEVELVVDEVVPDVLPPAPPGLVDVVAVAPPEPPFATVLDVVLVPGLPPEPKRSSPASPQPSTNARVATRHVTTRRGEA